MWSFTGGDPIRNAWATQAEVPAETPLSRELSRALWARGFRFVGPVITYAWMQACGLVDDHVTTCFRHCGGEERRTAGIG